MDKGTKRLLVLAMVVFAFALGMLFNSQIQTQTASAQAGGGHSLDAADGDPTDAVFVDNDGRVGIGTTSPEQNLHISDPADARFRLAAGDAAFQLGSQGLSAQMGTLTDHDFYLYTNNARRLTVARDGRVGIGTAAPVQDLHIADSNDARIRVSAGPSIFQLESQGSFTQLGSVSNHDIHFFTNNARRAVITSGGKVGVGTTSPTEKLDVNGNIHLSGMNPKITSSGEICIGSGCP